MISDFCLNIYNCNDIQEYKLIAQFLNMYLQLDIISKLKRISDFPTLKQKLTKKNTEVLQYKEKIIGEPQPESEKNEENRVKFSGDSGYAERLAGIDSLLATLIATVTFAAAFQVPGGYESDGPYMGLPILRNKTLFKVFMILDSLAFGLSSCSIFLQFLATMVQNSDTALRNARLTIFYSILAMVATFISAIHLVSGDSKGAKTAAHVCIAAFLSGYVFFCTSPIYIRKSPNIC